MAFSYNTFSVCLSDRQSLSVGDPGLIDWTVNAAYDLAAACAAVIQWRAPFARAHRCQTQALWVLISLLMVGLALNKQRDLLSLMTAFGCRLTLEQDWYESRRLGQRDFVFGLIAVAVLTGGVMFRMLQGNVRQNLMPLLGLAALASFIMIRAGHLLHVFVPDLEATDLLLHDLTSALEVLCPVLIFATAWRLLRSQTLRSDP